MSTSVSSLTTNFFPSPQNGFTTTTSGSVSSGTGTVGLNSVAGYSNGQIAVFVIDPTDVSKKQTFTGVIDTSGVQVTSVVWTAGSNTTHASGATVVDYATATHIAMITKGISVEHNQNGTHKAVTATSLAATGAVTGASFNTTSPNGINQAALPLGTVVQAVHSSSTAVATGTTIIPYDDTKPQSTEGDQYFSQAITPKVTTNRLLIECVFFGGHSAANELIVALFQDSGTDALATVSEFNSTGTARHTVKLVWEMAAGTTSATTFKIRAGGAVSGTTTMNGDTGNRKFGGTASSYLRITEFKA